MKVEIESKYNLDDQFFSAADDSYHKAVEYVVREIRVCFGGPDLFKLIYVGEADSVNGEKPVVRECLEEECFVTEKAYNDRYSKRQQPYNIKEVFSDIEFAESTKQGEQ